MVNGVLFDLTKRFCLIYNYFETMMNRGLQIEKAFSVDIYFDPDTDCRLNADPRWLRAKRKRAKYGEYSRRSIQ